MIFSPYGITERERVGSGVHEYPVFFFFSHPVVSAFPRNAYSLTYYVLGVCACVLELFSSWNWAPDRGPVYSWGVAVFQFFILPLSSPEGCSFVPGHRRGERDQRGRCLSLVGFLVFGWCHQVYTVMVIIAFVFYLHYFLVFAGIATHRSLNHSSIGGRAFPDTASLPPPQAFPFPVSPVFVVLLAFLPIANPVLSLPLVSSGLFEFDGPFTARQPLLQPLTIG